MKQNVFLMRYALSVFAIVITVGVLARIFFFASYVNSGWAMLPSIWPGDFIFAVQWPVKNLKRGDVVALRCPGSKAQLCLKRVVGLPGDRLEFQSGNVSVNGQPAKHIPISPQVFQESLLGESWLIWPDESTDLFAEPVVVPPRQVYLLNDKRSDREDSRAWGPISMDLLEAKAVRVWLSLDWFDSDKVRSWPRVRWTRILRSID